MSCSKPRDKISVDGAIIDAIQEHDIFYDKEKEEYHKSWRDGRQQLLKAIAERIATTYEIPQFDETMLWNRWKALKARFREEHKKVEERLPSGSAASKIISSWPLYDDMLWLLPYVEHMPQTSNDSCEGPGLEQPYRNPHKRRKCKKDDEEEINGLENLLEQNGAVLRRFESQLEESAECQAFKNYWPIIALRYQDLPEKKRYECTSQVLNYIRHFKKKETRQ